MTEWSALAAAVGILIVAGAAIVMMLSLRKLLQHTEAVLAKLEQDSTQLAQEASQVLKQASVSMEMVQRQLAAGEALTSSLNDAASAIAKTADAVHAVGKKASITAIEHLERARLDNERHIGEMFRWIDAGMTLWHSWSRYSSAKSGEGQAK
ncbi:DUF948 domain-containing protein [Paenibacillus ihbetae]|uniref:DUF948 domain-containing protein n=1 Tax=Paenibacillus ihbetae TaxID=1870820 RepID=A0A1B2E588_9BACL|nr:DUF948 domain-containing protein [Paenibacillus ihbetae]ANY75067.1 hypothetical protein BBD41_22235 [Paenibacillus ihbetae]OOC62768.1 hypothetical protein BBD40_13405 [Paenibacillus ihbetae]